MTGELQGRRIVVTGASSGIGEAIARAASAAGARVAVLARTEDKLRALAGEFGGVAVPADVADVAAARRAVDQAAEELGGLDGLVNAAGVLRGGPLATTDPADWKLLFDVNVLGVLHTVQAAASYLVAADHADIVNVSSMSGRRLGSVEMAAYAASKAAVHMLTEGMRRELGPEGVRVSTLAPGFVRTGLFAAGDPDTFREGMGERAEEAGLDPRDVAATVIHALAAPPEVVHVELAMVSNRQ
jgi:clavulanate-9-aldehyde reducatase